MGWPPGFAVVQGTGFRAYLAAYLLNAYQVRLQPRRSASNGRCLSASRADMMAAWGTTLAQRYRKGCRTVCAATCNALRPLQVPLQVACRSHRCRMAIMPSPHPRITLARIFRPVLALVGNLLKAQDIGARQSVIIALRGDAGLPVSVSLTRAARVRDAWLTPVTAPENEGAAAGARYLLGAGGAFDLLPPDT